MKQLSDYKTLHDLKSEIESLVNWFNERSTQTKLIFQYTFDIDQSYLRCSIQNKMYDYEEITMEAYNTNSKDAWRISSSFIKGNPSDSISDSTYQLDEIRSLKDYLTCPRNHLMDILVDERVGIRNEL